MTHRSRFQGAALLAASVFLSWSQAAAQSPSALDASVRTLLKNQCADCHFAGVKDGKKGQRPLLDGSLSREQLSQLSKGGTPIVKFGDPEGSLLFSAVSLPDDDEDRMPKSTEADPRRALNADEKALLARWIRGEETGVAKEAPRAFIREIDVLRLIAADLRAHPNEARNFRYLTLHHLWNLGPNAEPATQFVTYRAAVAKLLNSLSWRPTLAVPVAIDPNQLILRVRLSDYGWESGGAWDEWREVAVRYPYAFATDARDPDFRMAQAEVLLRTGSIIENPPTAIPAVIRADWFVFACAQPPLYDELLYRRFAPGVLDANQAADHALERVLGVDVGERLRAGLTAGASLADELDGAAPAATAAGPSVLRAGFNPSGVSRANRLVERHAIDAARGYWKSYDFNEDRRLDEGNLVLRPLGPKGAGLSAQHEFLHDGGEMIFSLPNGLQGYLLTTAVGKRLAIAPANIVEDRTTFRAGRPILNGISCMICHDAGMKRPPALDANGRPKEIVLTGVDRSRLSQAELRALRFLYAEPEVVHRTLERDAERFGQALRPLGAAGLPSEPIGVLYGRFLQPLDAAAVLVELDREPKGETVARLPEVMAKSAANVVASKAVLLRSGAGVARAEFLELFRTMAEELANKHLLPFAPTDFAEFGEKAPPPPPPLSPKQESAVELKQELLRLADEAERVLNHRK